MTIVNTDYPAVIVFGITKVLTDEQIKALPTTPVQILPAPGANKICWVIGSYAHFKSSGAYANFGLPSHLNVGPASPADAFCSQQADIILSVASNVNSPLLPAGPNGTADADVVNKPITIYVDNGGAGVFTGGNAANALSVTVLYTIIDVQP